MFCNRFIRSFVSICVIWIVAGSRQTVSAGDNSASETAETLILQAASSFAAGDFRKNADLLKQAADTDPNNRKVWWKLCEAYQLTEEMDLAVKACKQELRLYPSSSSHNGLGLVYLAEKDWPRAASEFEKAAADSDISQIHSNYVWALLESKQYERAIPAAQRLVEVSKADPPQLKTTQSAYHDLAIAYMKTGHADKAQEAVRNGYGAGCLLEVGDRPEDSMVRCKAPPTASNTVLHTAQPSAPPRYVAGITDWVPTWDTTPDKTKKAKSVLSPKIAFTDSGFRGSPVPHNDGENNREDFARAFQNEHECFGITLTPKDPENADFGLQVFNGIEGRVGQWQWVVYRMDTLGERAHGETTGGMSLVIKSVCSVVRDAVTSSGGRVESGLK